VRELRQACGLTQDQLSARCGALGWDIGTFTISKIENFQRSVFDAEMLVLARALKTTVPHLFPRQLPRRELTRTLNKPRR
jgi:transcriptional regulator with XRE-family HTH domain